MDDIRFDIGSVNPSGVSSKVYFIPKNHIKRWPAIEDDFERALLTGNYTGYNGSFVLKQGCWWSRLYSTQGKGKVDWEFLGETDCKVVVNKASLSYPKLNDQGRAMAKYASNGDFVFVVKHDSQYFVIGSRDYRATLTPNGDSGDAPGSDKGIKLDIECPDTTPLPTYKGEIILEDGILYCNTDSFQNFEDMNTNKLENYTERIEGGKTVRFDALGNKGRIHLEGSGPIKVEVGVDGVSYKEVEHSIEFVNGVAIAPISFYLGDKVQISATTLTKVLLNYNDLKTN